MCANGTRQKSYLSRRGAAMVVALQAVFAMMGFCANAHKRLKAELQARRGAVLAVYLSCYIPLFEVITFDSYKTKDDD